MMNDGDRILDTRNPFYGRRSRLRYKTFSGNLGRPITKKSSFFLDFNKRLIDQDNLIKARHWEQFCRVPYIGAFPTPNRLLMLSGRIDYALTPTDTLVMRYTHSNNTQTGGVAACLS